MAELPRNLRQLIAVGGVEVLVQAAGEHAMRREREFWLPVLERNKLPEDADIFDQLTLQIYIAGLRRKLGMAARPSRNLLEIPVRAKAQPDADTIRAQTRERVRKHRQRTRGAQAGSCRRTVDSRARLDGTRHTGKTADPGKGFAYPPQTRL